MKAALLYGKNDLRVKERPRSIGKSKKRRHMRY